MNYDIVILIVFLLVWISLQIGLNTRNKQSTDVRNITALGKFVIKYKNIRLGII